jgi:outer membrane protein OmpA-like peptidoglycan-associated protein
MRTSPPPTLWSPRRAPDLRLPCGGFGGKTAFAATGLAALLMVSLSSPGTAGAQEDPPSSDDGDDEPPLYRFEFGLYGGVHFFAQKHGLRQFSDDPEQLSPKDAGAFGGRFTLNLNAHVALEGDAWWTPTRTIGRDEMFDTKLSVFGYRASLLIDFVGGGPFRPFLLLGAGGMSSIVDNQMVLPNDQDPLVHGGLGAKIYFTPRVGLRLEGIIMGPPAFASDVIKIGSETSFGGPDFQALGTLFFNLAEVPRPTRQVIVKKETVVMQPATPVDPDADGVAGDADRCPNVAEDRDGFEDEDGCPDNDNDKDGIPDPQDRCPNKAETVNGLEDDDGCPEEDTDGDGFVGSRDKCPDAPETKNGFQDDDGCPDELPPAVKKFSGVIEGINFKTGSANILPGSFNVLDRAVQVLKEFTDIKLEIQGHTDNRGGAAYNRDLSQRRADAVRTYLVSRGIGAERLTAVGFGFDRPIADNSSESGRSRNRRTEFKLVTAP